MKIRILDEAQLDLEIASEFYESQSRGLGTYFLEHIFADIGSLVSYAGNHYKTRSALLSYTHFNLIDLTIKQEFIQILNSC